MYFYFMFSFCPSKFWQKSVDQWTSNDNSEKKSFSLMYILIYKCVICGQKVPFYFMFSFCYVLFTILTQKVWTGGQVLSSPLLKELGHLRTITILSSFDRDLRVMRILKKITSVISSFKSVNCVKEAVFLLHLFFLSFKILKKKCGPVDK